MIICLNGIWQSWDSNTSACVLKHHYLLVFITPTDFYKWSNFLFREVTWLCQIPQLVSGRDEPFSWGYFPLLVTFPFMSLLFFFTSFNYYHFFLHSFVYSMLNQRSGLCRAQSTMKNTKMNMSFRSYNLMTAEKKNT